MKIMYKHVYNVHQIRVIRREKMKALVLQQQQSNDKNVEISQLKLMCFFFFHAKYYCTNVISVSQ